MPVVISPALNMTPLPRRHTSPALACLVSAQCPKHNTYWSVHPVSDMLAGSNAAHVLLLRQGMSAYDVACAVQTKVELSSPDGRLAVDAPKLNGKHRSRSRSISRDSSSSRASSRSRSRSRQVSLMAALDVHMLSTATYPQRPQFCGP